MFDISGKFLSLIYIMRRKFAVGAHLYVSKRQEPPSGGSKIKLPFYFSASGEGFLNVSMAADMRRGSSIKKIDLTPKRFVM